jgi:hypothetical protein
MIDGNILKFGYGSILVSSNPSRNELEFIEIKPPVEIGSNPSEGSFEKGKVVGFYYASDLWTLIKRLETVDEINNTIKFRGYIFDFTNYNDKSITVVLRGVRNFCHSILRTMAC